MTTVVRIPASAPQRDRRRHGIKVGCCRICTCKRRIIKISFVIKSMKIFLVGLYLEFLTTKCGLLKIFELLLGKVVKLFYHKVLK